MAKKNYAKDVDVKIDGKEWKDALDAAFKVKVKDVKVDGFRKGKVPRDIYERKYGKESLFVEAADKVIDGAYKKALDESKLVPVTKPNVEIKSVDEKEIVFTFAFITRPELKIKTYKGLKIKKEEVKVTKEEIEHEMGHLLERYEEIKVKETGALENGNVAIIDFEGFKDGKAFDGGKAENYELEIGSGRFIPGFEEQLVGMKKDEEKEIKVTFPEDYPHDDLKGKEATFKVKLHEIKEKIKREFDKELFDDIGIDGVDSKEKLEDHIKEDIKKAKEADAEARYEDKVLEEVAKNVEVDIPQEMVDEETDRLMKRFEQQIAMQGLSLDIYYQFTQSTEKDLREQMDKEAYKNVLYRLMLEEIMNLEKIEISMSDAEKEADELAKKYKMKKEEFLKQFGGIEMIQYDLEMRKVIETLKELNK